MGFHIWNFHILVPDDDDEIFCVPDKAWVSIPFPQFEHTLELYFM